MIVFLDLFFAKHLAWMMTDFRLKALLGNFQISSRDLGRLLCSCSRGRLCRFSWFLLACQVVVADWAKISHGLGGFVCIRGFSEDVIFSLLINGLDSTRTLLQRADFLKRGEELKLLLDSWLARW